MAVGEVQELVKASWANLEADLAVKVTVRWQDEPRQPLANNKQAHQGAVPQVHLGRGAGWWRCRDHGDPLHHGGHEGGAGEHLRRPWPGPSTQLLLLLLLLLVNVVDPSETALVQHMC